MAIVAIGPRQIGKPTN